MCGIAGYFSTTSPARMDDVRAMCDAIVHRGPDDAGYYVRDGVALGMRRLSIIDVSGGHQPIHNEDKTLTVVFNGEIYNFPELRAGLEARGHRFSTQSDTECLVHLYEEYGANLVDHLRGMFAFALHDEPHRRLLLARDRLGKKPLHYALVDGTLYFASEIKSIFAVRPDLAEKDEASLAYYFSFGYIPDPLTAFRGIQKLPAGHLLEYQDGKLHMRKYWDLPEFETDRYQSEAEALDRLESELSQATKLRLISDVPLGAFLSGGVDSSLVVGLMARNVDVPVRTFSIAFQDEGFNEAKYAKRVAEAFKTEHTEFVVRPDAVELLDRLSRLLDEPFSDPSLLPTYIVSSLARQHVTVALSGDGGDELFAGYERYQIAARRNKLRIRPQLIADFYRRSVFPHLPSGFPARNLIYNLSLDLREGYIHGISSLAPEHAGASVLSADYSAFAKSIGPTATFARIFDEAPASSEIGRLQALDIKTYLVGDILTKVDRMSMGASLEVRSPLLDHFIVELALRMPLEWKISAGEQKYILKKLAERIGVPRDVLYRRKQGFAVPLVRWMRSELKDLVYSTLLDSHSIQRGYLSRAGIELLVEEHMRGRRDHSSTIFQLLMFELWHRNYLSGIGTPARSGRPAARDYVVSSVEVSRQ